MIKKRPVCGVRQMQFAKANIASYPVAQNLCFFAAVGSSAGRRLDRTGRLGLGRRSNFSDGVVQAGTDRGGDDAQNTYQTDPHGSRSLKWVWLTRIRSHIGKILPA